MLKTPILEASEAGRLEVDAVAAALERAPKLVKLLRYLAEKYFAGDGEQPTEFSIATEVFEKSETSFIASEDAVARVETHRLRKKLKAYYSTEGKDHPIQISIPLGMYTLAFVRAGPDADSLRVLPEEPRMAEVELDFISGPAIEQENVAPLPAERPEAPGRPISPQAPGKRFQIYLAILLSIVALGFGIYGFRRSHRAHPVPKNPSVDKTSGSVQSNSAAPTNSVPVTLPFRMIAGYSGPPQTDSAGEIWRADKYYSNGSPIRRSITFIDGTSDPLIFRNGRAGNFGYDIPLRPGVYELHLYFAAITSSPKSEKDVSACVFNVLINGKIVLQDFDPVSDAMGLNIADERVLRDVSPDADGILHLQLTSVNGVPILSAMEIIPGTAGRQLPVRITAQPTPWTDPSGQVWHPDSYSGAGGSSHTIWRGALALMLIFTAPNVTAISLMRFRSTHAVAIQ